MTVSTCLSYVLPADAVMAGARTLIAPMLQWARAVRSVDGNGCARATRDNNLRIVVSGSGTVDPNAKLFQRQFSPLSSLTTERAGPVRVAQLRRVAMRSRSAVQPKSIFGGILRWLRAKWNVPYFYAKGAAIECRFIAGGFGQ